MALTVYDIRGQLVESKVNGQQVPGRYSVRCDGTRLASGMYRCTLQAGADLQTQRLLLIRSLAGLPAAIVCDARRHREALRPGESAALGNCLKPDVSL